MPSTVTRDTASNTAPALGELHCVVDEVPENLAKPDRITMDDRRHAACDVGGDFDALVVGTRAEQSDDLLELAPQLERPARQLEFSCLGLREVEHVVDQRDQRFGGGLQRAHETALLRVERGVLEQRGHADDAVERRTQLVTHVGEESRLRLHRRFGGDAGLLEHLGVAFLVGDIGDHGCNDP